MNKSTNLVVAVAATLILHKEWADYFRVNGITSHLFPSHASGRWCADISAAGWMHVLVMTILLTLLFLYVVSPTPPGVILVVSAILTAHVFLGTVQPGWFCTGKLWTWENFATPLLAATLVWAVAIAKVHLIWRR